MTRTAATATSEQQASSVSCAQRGRSAGTVVARGSAYVVNVSLVTTRPASSRLTRVASTPNGPMSQCVVMPATISSACPSADRAT